MSSLEYDRDFRYVSKIAVEHGLANAKGTVSHVHPNIHRVPPPSPASGEFKTILSTLLNRSTSLFIHVQRNSLKTKKQR